MPATDQTPIKSVLDGANGNITITVRQGEPFLGWSRLHSGFASVSIAEKTKGNAQATTLQLLTGATPNPIAVDGAWQDGTNEVFWIYESLPASIEYLKLSINFLVGNPPEMATMNVTD